MADIKNIPDVIYLQVDPEEYIVSEPSTEPYDFHDLTEITWCVDRINITDVKYIRVREESE